MEVSKKDLKEILEKILKKEKKMIKLDCECSSANVLLELDENNEPKKIMGCRHYTEKNGECDYLDDNCVYSHWKNLKQYKE